MAASMLLVQLDHLINNSKSSAALNSIACTYTSTSGKARTTLLFPPAWSLQRCRPCGNTSNCDTQKCVRKRPGHSTPTHIAHSAQPRQVHIAPVLMCDKDGVQLRSTATRSGHCGQRGLGIARIHNELRTTGFVVHKIDCNTGSHPAAHMEHNTCVVVMLTSKGVEGPEGTSYQQPHRSCLQTQAQRPLLLRRQPDVTDPHVACWPTPGADTPAALVPWLSWLSVPHTGRDPAEDAT